MRAFPLIFCFFLSLAVWGQTEPTLRKSKKILSENRFLDSRPSDSLTGNFNLGERQNITKTKPITDYLIISQNRDTTYVDTTLTLEKLFKFNVRRKDDFEHLPLANSGQVVNRLSLKSVPLGALPEPGFLAKKDQYFQPQDLSYYHVPTPLTEMFYKTTFNQGQSTDVLITANLSPRLNYAIGYRGHRSLGHYQHSLSGMSQLRITARYENPNGRYRMRLQVANQKIEQQENGGLTATSVDDFLNEVSEFEDRARLSVKFEDAINQFTGKRYLLENDYALLQSQDSIPKPLLRLGYRVQTDSQTHTFDQDTQNDFFGDLHQSTSGISDNIHYATQRHDLYTVFEQSKWGQIEAYASSLRYEYQTQHIADDISLSGSGFALGGKLRFVSKKIETRAQLEQTFDSSQLANKAFIDVVFPDFKGLRVSGGLRWHQYHPGLNYAYYHSAYQDYTWETAFQRSTQTMLYGALKHSKYGTLQAQMIRLDNYAFFEKSLDSDFFRVLPQQWNSSINLLKLRWDARQEVGKFSLQTEMLYQQTTQDNVPLHLPDFVGRATLSYADHWFAKASFVHLGLSAKYFSEYYGDAYNPVLSEFVVQKQRKIGGTPIVEAFFNMKIKQTRLYVRAEHLSALWDGNTKFSSPDYPYRDFILRFGLVWNFFR